MNRRLKLSCSPANAEPTNAAISSSLESWTNISPSPVRSQCSDTLNSRHIRAITASIGSPLPVSYFAIVFLLIFSLSANCCWVYPRTLLNFLIRFFILSPPLNNSIINEKCSFVNKKMLDKCSFIAYSC